VRVAEESAIWLPTKNDPESCAMCVGNKKGVHDTGTPYKLCHKHSVILSHIVAGEVVRARTPIPRKGIRPSHAKAATKGLTEDGYVKVARGESYACRTTGCPALLIAGRLGALRKYCADCAKTRIRDQKNASERRRYRPKT
jgi:hypothetical protein